MPQFRTCLTLVCLSLLGACVKPALPGVVGPREAIAAATADRDGEARGTFAFLVRRVESAEGRVFINSETDYRRPDCLTVVVSPRALAEFLAVHKLRFLEDLRGRTLRVTGTARRVRVDFVEKGEPTGRFYYQTHVRADGREQLELLPQ